MGQYDFESIAVDGRRLRYVCRGEGSPTVVLEQGLGASVEASLSGLFPIGWAKVFAEVQKTTRFFAYDRAGLGRSDAARGPRTSRDLMHDLHELLRKTRIPPPYILVGHSIGGLTARWFAERYPGEVAGMVLVDSSHPDQSEKFAAALPAESPGEPTVLKAFRRGSRPNTSPERFDFAASVSELPRSRAPLGAKPLVVLSHGPTSGFAFAPGLPPETGEKLERVWLELQADLLSLSVNRSHRIADLAGHNIQIGDPQLVIDAILDVVKESRAGPSSIH